MHEEQEIVLAHMTCGTATLLSKTIKSAKVVGFADLGMEAIYEFDVVDMPVTAEH